MLVLELLARLRLGLLQEPLLVVEPLLVLEEGPQLDLHVPAIGEDRGLFVLVVVDQPGKLGRDIGTNGDLGGG